MKAPTIHLKPTNTDNVWRAWTDTHQGMYFGSSVMRDPAAIQIWETGFTEWCSRNSVEILKRHQTNNIVAPEWVLKFNNPSVLSAFRLTYC